MLKITGIVGDSWNRVDFDLETDLGTEVHVTGSTFRRDMHDALLDGLKLLEHDIHEFVEANAGSSELPLPF